MPWVEHQPGHAITLVPDPEPPAKRPEITADQAAMITVGILALIAIAAFAGLRLFRRRAAAQALAEKGVVSAGATGLRAARAMSAYLGRLKARIVHRANATNR